MHIDRELLVTGIPIIDHQHDEYANLVDKVFELASQGQVSKRSVIIETNAVIRYAVNHFDAEETLMIAEDYPEYERHRAKHDVFRTKTDSLPAVFDEDMDFDEYMITLSKWLIEWFCDQVQTDDVKLAAFLHNK